MDILQGSFRLCNWLSLRRLVSWINHLPPACWSTFWKSNFKQQLGRRFDIMDNKSYFFVFWHMQLYVSWYIRSFFGFTFLNILYFFKYSCTNIFHRRSLYTSYFYRRRRRHHRRYHHLGSLLYLSVSVMDHSGHSNFVLVVSSHGNRRKDKKRHQQRDFIVGVNEGVVDIDTLTKQFSDSHCPSLKGKPKLFFIQVGTQA